MNTIKMLTLLSTGFILSSSSCDKERNESSDDKLSLEKINYKGNELRIDGYYYQNYISGDYIHTFFLYKNGIILDGMSIRIDKILEKEENFRNGFYATNVASKYKYQWGVFQIDGTKIKYEKWVPTNGPFPAVTYEGVILNDSTFVINKSYRALDAGKKVPTEHYWEYHFKEFSPKPDSTNRFIP
jgi:hypothetical protein